MIELMERVAAPIANLVGVMLVPVGAFIAADSADVERWVGGGVIVAAGVFLVRWALKTSERVESTYLKALTAANERADRAEKSRMEYQIMYETERELRMQLEQRGMTDRRHDPREDGL